MLAQFYPPVIGGEERHVRNLSIALAKRGHTVWVGTLSIPGTPSEELDEGINIVRLRSTMQRSTRLYSDTERMHAPPFPDPELTYHLKKLIDRFNPDIVHAHNWIVHSLWPLKSSGGPKFVLTLHDYSLVCAKKSFMYENAMCKGPSAANCLKCVTDHYGPFKGTATYGTMCISSVFERRSLDKILSVSRAVGVGNGLDDSKNARYASHDVVPNFIPDQLPAPSIDDYPEIQNLPDKEFILFVGDLRELKGLNVLLQAYKKLLNPPPLVLIGRRCPDTPSILPQNTYLFESWPHGAVLHAWSKCLFGVAPSIWAEPCATVVMEGMSFGKPMITSDIGGMPDIIEHRKSGLLTIANNAASLHEAMQQLIDDPGLRKDLSQGALKRVKCYQANRVVSRIEQIYSDILRPSAQSTQTLEKRLA